jgi:hypothetical protein
LTHIPGSGYIPTGTHLHEKNCHPESKQNKKGGIKEKERKHRKNIKTIHD